jgi:transmembrane sensor
MTHDEFLSLVSKKLSGEATGAELEALEQQMAANAGLAQEYRLLQQYWEEQPMNSQVAIEESLQGVLQRLGLPATVQEEAVAYAVPVRSIWPRFKKVAAVAAVLLLAGAAFFVLRPGNKKATQDTIAGYEKKQNTPGTKSIIELADGSKVWLNADSRLQYPPSFANNTREVYLDGEAFFEVAKNPQRPFIIHLNKGTIRVLGTSFNVRAYDNEKSVETSVMTGKVAFIPKYQSAQKQDTVFVTPNNKVSYQFTEEKMSMAPTMAANDKAWTEGKLIFKAMTMEEIAMELERNFGKKVVFLDEAAKQYVFTGSFQNNTLEEIMYYLSLSKTQQIFYKITNDELLIALEASKL